MQTCGLDLNVVIVRVCFLEKHPLNSHKKGTSDAHLFVGGVNNQHISSSVSDLCWNIQFNFFSVSA